MESSRSSPDGEQPFTHTLPFHLASNPPRRITVPTVNAASSSSTAASSNTRAAVSGGSASASASRNTGASLSAINPAVTIGNVADQDRNGHREHRNDFANIHVSGSSSAPGTFRFNAQSTQSNSRAQVPVPGRGEHVRRAKKTRKRNMEQADDEDDDDTIQVSRRKHRAMQDKLMLYESAFPDLTREQLLELTNLSRRGGSASTRAHTIDTLSKKVATLERKNARLDEDLDYSEDRSWDLKEKLKTTQEKLVATQRSAEIYEDTAGQNVLQLHTFQGRLATSQARHAVTQRELSASTAREQQYQVQLTAAADRERQFQLQIAQMQRQLEAATGGSLAEEDDMEVDPAQENTDVCRRGLGCRRFNCEKYHPGRGW